MIINFSYNFRYLFVLVFCLGFFSCQNENANSVKVVNSDNQWPMSGGPDGSWKVNTNLKVPTKWSVRSGENIKWKKTLPEGGQSGIAVWGDKLFLTINPPFDTPKHVDIVNEYNSAKKNYDTLFNNEVSHLNKKRDSKFILFKKTLDVPRKLWNLFLQNNENYQKASDIEKSKISENLMRKEEKGKAFAKELKKYKTYVHSKSHPLNKAYSVLIQLEKAKKGGAVSKDILLLCMDANNGATLWSKTVKGEIASEYNYGFSDSTTPCPITDGTNVWAINASGGMACFTLDGDLVWERTWMPSTGRPFNKQFDSLLFGDIILNCEPPEEGDSSRKADWNYLHAFDKKTGKRLWVTIDALTHYNTPILGTTKDNKPAVLIGRGGPHEVPERPVGLSLISLDTGNEGNAIWRWEPTEPNNLSGWGALSTQHWDTEKASWFYKGDEHATINVSTGKLIDKKSLSIANQYVFDENNKKYELTENVEIDHHENERHCNISTGDNVFYMVRYKPFIARHNVVTGKNELLELPREINTDGSFIWKTSQKNDGLNSKDQLQSSDARIKGNGFQKCFLGSPTMVNNYIFFTNALGMVYVIDANAKTFDASALVAVNDLGEKGKTWTVNSLTFANGYIYHRTLKEIICIGK
jgi:hypothetical protein